MSEVDFLLKAAKEFSDSIAFYETERGYVCYSPAHTVELRKVLEEAAFAYGRYLRANTQSALEN